MAYTEEQLIAFTKPLSDTEDQKAQNSINMVQSAIDNYDWNVVGLQKPEVRLKGSYHNDTNVKLDSDVDTYVLFTGYTYKVCTNSQSISPYHMGTGQPWGYFKDRLHEALKNKFGTDVHRGNKSFKIKENSYKHQTDVVCAFSAIDDRGEKNNCGICLFPDDDTGVIINYPEQDTERGKEKNFWTDHYYKKIVRIFKAIKNDVGLSTPSYLIECLISNVDNHLIADNSKCYKDKLTEIIDFLLRFLYVSPGSFYEVNQVKPLFHEKQKWTVDDAVGFLHVVKEVL